MKTTHLVYVRSLPGAFVHPQRALLTVKAFNCRRLAGHEWTPRMRSFWRIVVRTQVIPVSD